MVIDLIQPKKQAGTALLGIFHDADVRSQVADRIIDVRYEDLVADQESQTRRLLDYCDLDWDEACLSFHESDTAVTTASAVEVRQPIYRTSVGKWKNYRSQLAPLERFLREHDVEN